MCLLPQDLNPILQNLLALQKPASDNPLPNIGFVCSVPGMSSCPQIISLTSREVSDFAPFECHIIPYAFASIGLPDTQFTRQHQRDLAELLHLHRDNVNWDPTFCMLAVIFQRAEVHLLRLLTHSGHLYKFNNTSTELKAYKETCQHFLSLQTWRTQLNFLELHVIL